MNNSHLNAIPLSNVIKIMEMIIILELLPINTEYYQIA